VEHPEGFSKLLSLKEDARHAVVKKKKRNSRAAALAAEINDTLKLENPIRLGSDPYFTITRVPTGSLVMDRITGGGWALGRHYELFGDESVGKSTFSIAR
jgi:RecA/RadA recombinase